MTNYDPYTRYDQSRFTIRINTELLEKIKGEAEKNKRSTTKEIVEAQLMMRHYKGFLE